MYSASKSFLAAKMASGRPTLPALAIKQNVAWLHNHEAKHHPFALLSPIFNMEALIMAEPHAGGAAFFLDVQYHRGSIILLST